MLPAKIGLSLKNQLIELPSHRRALTDEHIRQHPQASPNIQRREQTQSHKAVMIENPALIKRLTQRAYTWVNYEAQ
jgi:hypothetical protein